MEPDRLRRIIASAAAGEEEGYRALLESYGKRLFAYFYRATASYHDSEDLLGELMLRLVRRLKDYVDQGRFEPWLFRIAANMVRDRIRRRKSAATMVPLEGEGGWGRVSSDHPVPRDVQVDAKLLLTEASERLNDALAKLDETTREMILLRHFGEMSFKEIADVFQCPLGTALAKVHRGLRKLRELMSEEDGSE